LLIELRGRLKRRKLPKIDYAQGCVDMRMEDLNENYYAMQITFSDDKKTFQAKTNPMSSWDNNTINITRSVFEELNAFIEYDFRFVFEYKEKLKELYEKILSLNINNDETFKLFDEYVKLFRDISSKIEKDLPLLSYTLNTFIDEQQEIENYIKFDFITPMNELWDELDGILLLQRDLYIRFEELANEQLEAEDRNNLPVLDYLGNFNIHLDLSYSDGELKQKYLVSSAEILYSLLTTYYFATKPYISLCNNCNRFFEPKTKKVTLYCDRVTDNGKSCKKVGAVAKFKINIDGDEVLKKYSTEKHRIYMYCTRSKVDEHDFLYDYYNWIDFFEPKIKEYKAGNIPADEIIKLLDEKSKEYIPYSKDKHETDW
jgi:hypothetical protein